MPQGDYDDGATAFVKLPEGGVDALLASSDSPLAAPGHGYVPPQITVAPATGTDPAATGSWTMPSAPSAPVDGAQWHVPDAGPEPAAHPGYAEYAQQDPYGGAAPYDTGAGQGDRFTYRPGATGQWDFSQAEAEAEAEAAAARGAVPGQDVTGQWSIPVADGDLPDESGEFTTSSLAEQWGGGAAPATLPGGAPAPWATQPAGQPWGDPAVEPDARPEGQPAETPPVPGPAVGPYGQHPHTEPAVGPAPGTPPAGRTAPDATDVPGDPEEAPEGPAEAAPDPAEDTGAASVPEAAERPVTDSAPAVTRESAPQPEPHPGQDPDATGHDPHATAPRADVADTASVSESAATPEPDATPETAAAAETAEATAESAETSEPVESVETSESADPALPQEPSAAGPHEEHPLASYVLRVNGTDRPVTDAWIGESLLYVLRERLGLAGAKDGCSQGECGACNVQVDGRLVASCLVPAVTSAGSEVRTVEGLATDGRPSDVQRALARRGAVQCGFCVPGMAMTVHNLLEGNPAPTELEARQALCGNLCRCSGYRGVLEAVKEVVAEREAHADTDAQGGAGPDEPRIPHQAGPGAGGVNPSAFESQPPPGTPDATAPHDQPYGDHGQDGGHA
ncbi:(2Fe-2S)-binding protein [Streptomyces lienomycini]|uniref:2Fe-2S iron-sulfur cluster-binding protein n=1 Tax=Streptomyces lienomycini TaxID=284035 RepID=A0ABV9WWM1_9ACTN|nr:2Fe-2S iron-sulfur cluster-binding protein [Streptomyces lienomycini]